MSNDTANINNIPTPQQRPANEHTNSKEMKYFELGTYEDREPKTEPVQSPPSPTDNTTQNDTNTSTSGK